MGEGKLKIGIGPFYYDGLHPYVVKDIEGAVGRFLVENKEFDVLNYKDVQEPVDLRWWHHLKCRTDLKCALDLGANMKVDQFIVGNVLHRNGIYQLDLQLIDVKEGKTRFTGFEKTVADRMALENGLKSLTNQLADHLWIMRGGDRAAIKSTDVAANSISTSEKVEEATFFNGNTNKWLKWGGLGLAASAAIFGVVMGSSSNTQSEDYERSLSRLENTGAIVPTSQGGYKFRDQEAKSKYKGELDDLKTEGERAGFLANVGFIAAGAALVASGLLFYLDYNSSEEKKVEPQMMVSPISGATTLQFSF